MIISQIFQYTFIQRAFITGGFVALLCSCLGLFLVLKRFSLIGDGLSHVSFGAIAVGLFLGFYPLYVAVPLVVASSLLILRLSQKARVYSDAAIGIVSSVALAGGVMLASAANGFNVDLFSYLFGNILAISQSEMLVSIVLSLFVLLFIYLYYWQLVSITFNEELAHTTGIKTQKINTVLVILTAVTVVLSVKVVGILLISSFLILPAVSSLQVAKSFQGAITISALFAVISLVFGIITSFAFNIPSGASVVMANFILFLITWTYSRLFSVR